MDYLNEIATYKQQRDVTMKSFREVTFEKNDLLADYFYDTFQKGEDVTFSVLNKIEVGKAVPLPVVHGGAIMTIRQPTDTKDTLEYTTKWSPGSTLTYHYHSDCTEKLTVREGSAKVFLKGEALILHKGDSIEISAHTGHQVTALEKSEIDIFFRRVSQVKINVV